MNEPKPEDVMKALECCITKHHENCCLLGNWSEEWNCMTDLMKKALALLREKEAEIERLKSAWKQQNKQLSELAQQYHQRGKDIISQYDGSASMMIDIIRAEAITEFAERLKPIFVCKEYTLYTGVSVHETIDQISKEIKEEADERPE